MAGKQTCPSCGGSGQQEKHGVVLRVVEEVILKNMRMVL